MRVPPTGMLFHALTLANPNFRAENLSRAFDLECEAAALTHGHLSEFLTSGVMGTLVFELLDGTDLSFDIERVTPLLTSHERHEEALAWLQQALALLSSNAALECYLPTGSRLDRRGGLGDRCLSCLEGPRP